MARRNLAALRPIRATAAETQRVVTAEKGSLARSWLSNNDGQRVVGLASTEALQATVPEWERLGYEIQPINKPDMKTEYSSQNAFALVQKNLHNPECWVLGLESDYRTIYHDFLTQYFNFAPDVRISSRYQIDHVLARSHAKKMFPDNGRSCFLRVTAAKTTSNINAEQVYEKFASERQLNTVSQFGRAILNFPLAIKTFDLPSPGDRQYADKYVVNACRKMLRKNLLSENELDIPYALIRNTFMQSSIHPPVDNSIRLVSGSHVLEMASLLREWIDHY